MDPVRVIVVGCGGIGSWLSHGIARALEFQAPMSQLVLIDGDSFEAKNVERQMFSQYGNKAHALRNDIQHLVPSTFVLSRAAWIVSSEAATEIDPEEEGIEKISPESLLKEGDIVFSVVDNYAARKIIFDAAKNINNIDVFTGGNDDRLFGSVYHYCRRDGKEVTHHPSVFHDEFTNPEDRNPGEMSCQERAALEGGTQLLAVNMAVAAQLLAKFSHVVFGTEEEKESAIEKTEIYFDLEKAEIAPADRRVLSTDKVAITV